MAQTVISIKDSKIDGAISIAALKEATLGAQVGTRGTIPLNPRRGRKDTGEPAGFRPKPGAART